MRCDRPVEWEIEKREERERLRKERERETKKDWEKLRGRSQSINEVKTPVRVAPERHLHA